MAGVELAEVVPDPGVDGQRDAEFAGLLGVGFAQEDGQFAFFFVFQFFCGENLVERGLGFFAVGVFDGPGRGFELDGAVFFVLFLLGC